MRKLIVACIGVACASCLYQARAADELYPADYFRSPQFRKAFLASLGVKTEVEPKLTEEEQHYLSQIEPHLADALDDSLAALLKITTPESTARFDYELGILYFRKNDLVSAEQWLTKAVTKFERFLRAHQNLGRIFYRLEKHARAVDHITKALALGQADEELYGLLGICYMATGQALSAESAFRSAVMLGPKTLDWKMGLAQAISKQGKAAEAVALFGELIQANPSRADLIGFQAMAHLANKAPLEAAKNLEVLAMMGKATPKQLSDLGDIYLNESIYALAGSAYLRSLQVKDSPASPESALRAVELLAARGAVDEVQMLASGIQDTFPQMDPALKTRMMKTQARVAIAQEKGEDAVALLKEIHAANPLDGEVIMLLADHFSKSDEKEQAVFYLERALKVPTVEAQASVKLAQAVISQSSRETDKNKRSSQLQRAIELIKRANELKPNEALARYLSDLERSLSKMRGG
ncbi:MAG: tetratricopeptide repeat protein [Verrucomicrobiaceae bacterium]|nr:tetratricopeptide repeat protein [Verrucomicrobiaceae bacterium]